MSETFVRQRVEEMIQKATKAEMEIIYQYIRTLLYG